MKAVPLSEDVFSCGTRIVHTLHVLASWEFASVERNRPEQAKVYRPALTGVGGYNFMLKGH